MKRTAAFKRISSLLIMPGLALLLWPYTASGLTGTVQDAAQQPVTGAVVRLVQAGTADTTGTDGRYELPGTSGIMDSDGADVRLVNVSSGMGLEVTLQRTGPVRITMYATDGRMAMSMLDATLSAGIHTIPVPVTAGHSGIHVVRVGIGMRTYAYKMLYPGIPVTGTVPVAALARPVAAAGAETLVVTHPTAPEYRVADPASVMNVTLQCTTAWLWARGMHGPSDYDEIDGVASDADGNVYATGRFMDTVSIDGWGTEPGSHGQSDIMVIKYTVTGQVAWVRHFGGKGEDNIFDAACDGEGNLVLSGWFEDTLIMDADTLVSEGDADVVIAKLAPDGSVLWALRAGSKEADGGNEVSIGPGNQIIIGADSKGHFVADGKTAGNDKAKQLGADAFILSINPDGRVAWIRAVQTVSDLTGRARAKAANVDAYGNVYLGGDYVDDIIVDPDAAAETLRYNPSNGPLMTDAYMTCWTAAGSLRWARCWGGSGNDICKGVTVNSFGEMYLAGWFEERAGFGSDTLQGQGRDLFVWQLDTTGSTRWLRHISSPELLTGAELELDAEGRLIFGTGLTAPAYFESGDGRTDTLALPGAAAMWPVMVRYDRTGTLDFSSFAGASVYGRLGEITRSGNLVFYDVAYRDGPHRFGPDELYSDSRTNIDAGVAVISVHD